MPAVESSNRTKILSVLVERGLARGLALVGFVLVARWFGAEEFGRVSYVFALGAFFAPISTFGLGNVMLRYFGTGLQSRAVSLAGRWRLIWGGVCFLLFPWVYQLMAPDNPLPMGFVWLFATMFLLAWLTVGEEWMFFAKNNRNLIAAGLAGSAGNLLVRLGVIVVGGPVGWLLAVPTVETLIKGAINWFGARGRLWGRREETPDVVVESIDTTPVGRAMWRDGINFTLAGISVLILTRMDLVMLGKLAGEREVGIYAVAVQLVDMVPMVLVILVRMLGSDLVTLFRRGEEVFVDQVSRVLGPGMWVLALAAVIMFWAGPWLVGAVFGPAFAEAGRPIAVLLLAQVFVFVGLMRGQYLALVQDSKLGVWATAIGALTNIGLNAWAIPRFGVMGAAGATCAARIFMSAIIPMFVPSQRIFNRALVKALLRPWGRSAL
ncbi:oligosaccharide flippase family protein [Synoicihabitans lomoniglobus]|uniref:Oligosaccharide flippase family protein n=1 Tax=Synoicihabitans lomoniglobus TaxID=2909285 RepID=A0AAF0I5S2_9BACT|nr:oligosaccharide flippase family protein [Opitutaceae bacterium LMO-M01]WED67513.1 oligosaccharide flippase family protein [Opitutaceae bacterium LMO-M01]